LKKCKRSKYLNLEYLVDKCRALNIVILSDGHFQMIAIQTMEEKDGFSITTPSPV
jgi:hypothetical protein